MSLFGTRTPGIYSNQRSWVRSCYQTNEVAVNLMPVVVKNTCGMVLSIHFQRSTLVRRSLYQNQQSFSLNKYGERDVERLYLQTYYSRLMILHSTNEKDEDETPDNNRATVS